MKVGIIGVGAIGGVIAQRLGSAGHNVRIANSRGPETIDATVLRTGAQAVHAHEVADGVDALIISVPLHAVPAIAEYVALAPANAAIIDTSNYYPYRDDRIEALDDGQVESLWVSEQVGRPIVKAWNAILAASLEDKAQPAGSSSRIALPVAGDDSDMKATAMTLVSDTGFDAVDAGSLAESWRQQPATPVYCTDHRADEIPALLERAARERAPKRRDLIAGVIAERTEADGSVSANFLLGLNRAMF